MRNILTEPVFTSVYSSIAELQVIRGSLYITGTSVEQRSMHTSLWEESCPTVTFARVVDSGRYEARVSVDRADIVVKLRSLRSISELLNRTEYSAVYLDITGLDHHIWAPFLRGMRDCVERGLCVYVEPVDYRFRSDPTEASIFDLSEHISGVEPLPGFVSLGSFEEGQSVFVPILGFEGTRFTFILETLQPDRRDVVPVVGVPGFRPEYPFYAYFGNRLPLEQTKAWQNVRFVPANCVFSLYHLLGQILEHHQRRVLRIAPIGTKPHALGAVLYYLDHPSTTELIYDHPIRKARRTVGVSRVCVYDVSLLRSSGNRIS